MDRLIRIAQRLALMLLLCAVAISIARESTRGGAGFVPRLIVLGIMGYITWIAVWTVRRLLPRRRSRPTGPPTLPTRGHWLSPRTLQRRGHR